MRIFNYFLIAGATCLLTGQASGKPQEPVKVHAVTDIAHEFSFYGDHRFHQQYLPDGKGVTNWCSLFNFDFSNANLLILLGCDDRISYLPQDIETIKNFLKSGGGVVILGDSHGKSQSMLANIFGVELMDGAKMPMKEEKGQYGLGKVEGHTNSWMKFQKAKDWKVIIRDNANQPVLAKTKYGKGNLLVGARGLAGSNPNAPS